MMQVLQLRQIIIKLQQNKLVSSQKYLSSPRCFARKIKQLETRPMTMQQTSPSKLSTKHCLLEVGPSQQVISLLYQSLIRYVHSMIIR